jgi:type IV secretion system protein VirD4
MQQHQILIGRDYDGSYLRLGGGEPVALHARTGTGKSVSMSIPNAFTWPGSMVVLDVKGEIFNVTAGHRAAMGQKVYRLSPASLDSRSHCWDPFAAVQRDSADRFAQIARLGNLLFPDEHQVGASANSQRFWENAGRQAFNAASTLMAETPGSGFLSIENITRLFTRSDGHEWMADRIDKARTRGDPYSSNVVDGISDYIGDDPKLRGDIRKTVSTRLQLWTYPQIAAVTARSDFDLRDLRRKPMTIYVVVSPGMIPTLRPLLRLFFDQAIALNTDTTPEHDPSLRHQCLFLMDEFARLGRMDALAQAAQYARGYGLRMVYVIQNKAQVRAIYGTDAAADIFDNVGAEIVFGTNDPALTKELEQRLGDNSMVYETMNRPRFWAWLNWNKQHANQHIQARPLMLDQEVMQMSPDEQLILRAGMKPMKTRRIRWFDDPNFKRLYRPAPEVPVVPQIVRMDDGTTRLPESRQPVVYHGR